MRRSATALATVMLAGLVITTSPASSSMPTGTAPAPAAPTEVPTATPAERVLPPESSLLVVLDGRVTSATANVNTMVPAHLKDTLSINGVLLAGAAAPVSLRVVGVSRAQTGDVDGALTLFVEPLDLGPYGKLPLRLGQGRITIVRTAGKRATASTADTVGDIFLPYYSLYHALRKGQDVDLPKGTIVRVRTVASVDASNPAHVVIAEPAPVRLGTDQPYSNFTPVPVYTPHPFGPPKASPSPRSTPSPAPQPSP